ncbi:MAG: hemerythrin domain-containing protein [Reyranellaceae bacterium]
MPTARTETSSRKSPARHSAAAKGPHALTLLRQDHDEVSAMFEKFEKRKDKMTPKQKQRLVEEICTALTVHARIEEEIFYPAVRPEIDDDDLMDEAVVEHQSLKELIAKIEDEGPEGEYYDAHVIVLGEYVKHHVKEEQNEMFKKVRATDIDLKELGGRLQQRKMELMGEAQEEA